MDEFDKRLKAMAEKEESIVPEGFDKRMQDVLDDLPPQKKKARLGAVKGVLIAAAACVLLVGTAFAASPGLREMLAEALGGFAPYAQAQDGEVYTWNGFEFEVLAALADENTVRVYTRITDLEGQGRVNINDERWLGGVPWVDVYVPSTSVDVTGGCSTTNFERYDEATQTSVAVTTIWGQITDDLTGAELRIDTAENRMNDQTAVTIPLDVEVMPSRTALRDVKLDEILAQEIRISPLGITVIIAKEGIYTKTDLDTTICICLKDGAQIKTEYDRTSGYGVYRDSDGAEHTAMIWNFADPVELDQIAGIYIGEEYIPVK